MAERTYASTLNASPDEVFDWHARPGAFQRLTPPWAPVRLESFEGIQEGDQAVIRLGPGPLSVRWVAEHHSVAPGRQFADRQVQGPFAAWNHVHRMDPAPGGGTRLTDHLTYEPPFGPVGGWLNSLMGGPELDRQFAYRHRITQQDLQLHRRYNPAGRQLRVVISGASGLIGSALAAFLSTGGHTVYRLVRHRPTGPREIYWSPAGREVDTKKLEGMDAVVHLAGENVFGLWTRRKRHRIYESRATGTRLLAKALAVLDASPDVFISASAVGYYGHQGARLVPEATPSRGGGFLAAVCRAWEEATEPAAAAGIRTVHPRIGIVLTPAGGALQLMAPIFSLGLGGRVGPADQYFPWIMLDDVLGALYHLLLTEDAAGPFNLSAPAPARMDTFTQTLASVLRRPALLRMPAPVVRRLAGEMADDMLLKSIRAVPDRLQAAGYSFLYTDLGAGLRHQLGHTLAPHDGLIPQRPGQNRTVPSREAT